MSFPEVWLPSDHSTIQALLVESFRNSCPSGNLFSLHRARLELCQSDHWILGHLHSAHLLPLLTLVWQPALGRILPDFFYSQMMATAVLSGSFSAAEISLLFPRFFPRYSSVSAVYIINTVIPWTPWHGLCSGMHRQLYDLIKS